MKETTKIVCPVCGAEFAISEHEHMATGMVVGRDSNLGTIYPEVVGQDKPNKAEARLEALRMAGVDTDNLFAARGASGDGMIFRINGLTADVVKDDDPIFDVLTEKGTIPERRLFRRWVMSQMLAMMTEKDWRTGRLMGITKAIHRKGYEYTWDMVVEEFRVQARLERNDAENFHDRNIWFNKGVAVAMAEDYIHSLADYVCKLTTRHCKGKPYKRIKGRNIFIDDLDEKLYGPLNKAKDRIANASDPMLLHRAVAKFDKLRVPLAFDTPQCREWIDAYKGSGAFYTMKNLVLFHKCDLLDSNGIIVHDPVAYLQAKAIDYQGKGWRMLGMMKEMIEYNHLDIEAKRAEWRAKKNC